MRTFLHNNSLLASIITTIVVSSLAILLLPSPANISIPIIIGIFGITVLNPFFKEL